MKSTPGARLLAGRGLRCRGLLLLEVVVALAVFVAAAGIILGAVSQSTVAMHEAEMRARAAGIARSAMSLLEAGVLGPEAINGPVRRWTEEESGAFEDAPASSEISLWQAEVRTEPSAYDGLTKVSVRVYRSAGPGGTEDGRYSYTLHQYVRLFDTGLGVGDGLSVSAVGRREPGSGRR